jgi:hypothetical protein
MRLGTTHFYRNKQILDEQNNKSTQFFSKFHETAFREWHKLLEFDWIKVLKMQVGMWWCEECHRKWHK